MKKKAPPHPRKKKAKGCQRLHMSPVMLAFIGGMYAQKHIFDQL